MTEYENDEQQQETEAADRKELYRLGRLSMAVCIPALAFCAVVNLWVSGIIALFTGVISFVTLKDRYGYKGAAAPLLSSISGTVLGYFFLSPILQEILNGL